MLNVTIKQEEKKHLLSLETISMSFTDNTLDFLKSVLRPASGQQERERG